MTRLLLAVCLTACGNHAEPVRPVAEPVIVRDAAEPNPSDTECDGLIDHAIDLQTPGDAGVGSDDRMKVRGEVRARILARCRAMPRAVYRCAMAATTLDAFTSCDPS